MFVDYPSVQLNLVLSAPSTRYSVEAESKAKENENIKKYCIINGQCCLLCLINKRGKKLETESRPSSGDWSLKQWKATPHSAYSKYGTTADP